MNVRPNKHTVQIDTEELIANMSEEQIGLLVSEILQANPHLLGRIRSLVNSPNWDQLP